LPSDTHKTLYKTLANVALRVKSTLEEEDATALLALVGEHRNIMDKIRQAGISQDPELLEQITKTREQINLAMTAIKRQRDELGRQLGVNEKKKTVSAVYAKNMTTRQP
jgi:hypothetical protein